MKERTYEDKEYWEKVYDSKERYLEEKVITKGNDGQEEFDAKVLNAIVGKVVLDVGCGDGIFTIEMGDRAKEVVGVDFSELAISKSQKNLVKSGKTNVRFQVANSNKLPFTNESFDAIVSRRGPVTSSLRTLSEAYRVLRSDGFLMEITIGEQDKRSLTKIFGRGQMYGVKEKVALSKTRMLKKSGFKVIEIKEYVATEIFQSMRDLLIRLKSAPIIQDFDLHLDKKYLELVERKCLTHKGIRTEKHRVTIIASKRENNFFNSVVVTTV